MSYNVSGVLKKFDLSNDISENVFYDMMNVFIKFLDGELDIDNDKFCQKFLVKDKHILKQKIKKYNAELDKITTNQKIDIYNAILNTYEDMMNIMNYYNKNNIENIFNEINFSSITTDVNILLKKTIPRILNGNLFTIINKFLDTFPALDIIRNMNNKRGRDDISEYLTSDTPFYIKKDNVYKIIDSDEFFILINKYIESYDNMFKYIINFNNKDFTLYNIYYEYLEQFMNIIYNNQYIAQCSGSVKTLMINSIISMKIKSLYQLHIEDKIRHPVSQTRIKNNVNKYILGLLKISENSNDNTNTDELVEYLSTLVDSIKSTN